jgi:hypothetical protein
MTLSTFPPYSPEKPSEITVGKNIIDAAKEVGVKFIVFRYVILHTLATQSEKFQVHSQV